MACAITLAADNESQAPILALWDNVAAFEALPSMRAPNYPPHITLALLPETAASDAWRKVQHVAVDAAPLRLCFNAIRAFEASPLVLWGAPVMTKTLADWHTKIHEHFDPADLHEHYRRGRWVPHCTLGTEILDEHRDRALMLTAGKLEPFQVVFDRFECVTFPPVERFAGVRL
ncbi:MAG: 2'-5' RNA ligase family protein [Alphaproteobacteria bacterium]|nr:2'-5' RNA ligase family protein [Alphaproteobacteria bacterium]